MTAMQRGEGKFGERELVAIVGEGTAWDVQLQGAPTGRDTR